MSVLTLKTPSSLLEKDTLFSKFVAGGGARHRVARADIPVPDGTRRFQERHNGAPTHGTVRDAKFAAADAELRAAFQVIDTTEQEAARAQLRASYEADGLEATHEPHTPDDDRTR